MRNKDYTRHDDSETASEMFMDAGQRGGGGPYVHCMCGKDHYAIHAYDDEDEDERPYLPPESENVVHHDDEYVYHFEFLNQVVVPDCEGCKKKLVRYEDFIWEQRDHIREYLCTRIRQEKAWVEQEHLKNVLTGIDKP